MTSPARVTAYRDLLLGLLPPGRAWNRQPDSVTARLLEAWAAEGAEVEDRAGDLLIELDPRTTVEMLVEWESMTGLPDDCTGQLDNLAQRRAAVLARLAALGGQTSAFYVSLAASLGYEITITEFTAFTAGMVCGLPLYGEDWNFAWQVNAAQTTVSYFGAGGNVAGDPLASWGNLLLECVLERAKPAHTIILFAYTE